MSKTPKPQPVRDLWNKTFYDSCRQGKLMLQRCRATGRFFFPPAPVSPFSGTIDWEWTAVSGKGELWSFVEFHQKYFDGFADEMPYVVVMVRLAEGPFLLTNLRGANVDDLSIGQKMCVFFDENNLPQFAPEL